MAQMKAQERQVAAYQESAESWKPDHHEAMRCMELEDMLLVGIGVYDLLEQTDVKLRLSIATGRSKSADFGFVEAMFALWLGISNRVDSHIEAFEAKGYEVNNSREFRARLAKARSAADDSEIEKGATWD